MLLTYRLSTIIILGLGLTIVSCGKKAGSKSSGETSTPQLGQTEIEKLLENQTVACDGNTACPNYLTKIAVIKDRKLSFCTGFLVNETTVATSASCLPNFIKKTGIDCSKDVFFFFPETVNRPAERVACQKVIQVSWNEGKDPVLWRDDVAFLELGKSLNYRRQAIFSRDGVVNNKEYNTWFVDQVDDSTAIIRREGCETLHNNYVNPFASSESSPNLIFGKCKFKRGSTGAPVIDSRGKVRAMVSLPISDAAKQSLVNTGLLTDPLKEMLHATNFACAPTIFDSDILDEKECSKDLNYGKFDSLRISMLSSNTLFADMKKKFIEALEPTNKYVRYEVKFVDNGSSLETKVSPTCFKPLNTWISSLNGTRNNYVFEVQIPMKTFKRTMDSSARVQGVVVDNGAKKYFMQFSLKNLRNSKTSTVFMWNSDENYTYSSLTETCQQDLLL